MYDLYLKKYEPDMHKLKQDLNTSQKYRMTSTDDIFVRTLILVLVRHARTRVKNVMD